MRYVMRIARVMVRIMLNATRSIQSLSFHLTSARLQTFLRHPQQGCTWSRQNNRIASASRYICSSAITLSSMQQAEIKGRADRFRGITVDSSREDASVTELSTAAFTEVLRKSLETWKSEGRRGIWFKVDLKQSAWIPVLINEGFVYHHAQRNYAMLLKWLPNEEADNIPHYAHTLVGVGAVVVNDNEEVLVVCEKYFDRPHWKLPGGYVEPGENLVDAAIREVYEETNIHTEFRSVLAFRHGHGGQFNCSDLYTVVSLRPLSNNLQKCEREIQDCKWMPVCEYVNHPDIHELNRLFVKAYLAYKKQNIGIDCKHGIHQILKKPYTVYYATSNFNDVDTENTKHDKTCSQ